MLNMMTETTECRDRKDTMRLGKIITNIFNNEIKILTNIQSKQNSVEDRIKRDLSDKVVSRMRRIDKIDHEIIQERERNKLRFAAVDEARKKQDEKFDYILKYLERQTQDNAQKNTLLQNRLDKIKSLIVDSVSLDNKQNEKFDHLLGYIERISYLLVNRGGDVLKDIPQLTSMAEYLTYDQSDNISTIDTMRIVDTISEYKKKFDKVDYRIKNIPNLVRTMHDYQHLIDKNEPFNIWGFKVYYADPKAAWVQIHELIIREEYYFSDDREAPHTIIDCGCNIGLSILYFKAMYPNSRIIAFEPNQKCYEIAVKNISENNLKDVQIINSALGASNETTTFFVPENDNMAGSLFPKDGVKVGFLEQEVKVEKLSAHINKELDLLKLDIEGAEYEVMNEIRDCLKYVKSIIIEAHVRDAKDNMSLTGLLNVLNQNSYRFQIGKSAWHEYHSSERPLTYARDGYSLGIYALLSDD